MPYVSVEVLTRVLECPTSAAVLAARRGPHAPWEPMLARYDAARLVDVLDTAILEGRRSFQQLFASIDVDPLPLDPEIERALRDWDTPDDIS